MEVTYSFRFGGLRADLRDIPLVSIHVCISLITWFAFLWDVPWIPVRCFLNAAHNGSM